MNRTRTLLILIAIVGALVAVGAIVNAVRPDGGGGGATTAPDATEEAASVYRASVDSLELGRRGGQRAKQISRVRTSSPARHPRPSSLQMSRRPSTPSCRVCSTARSSKVPPWTSR